MKIIGIFFLLLSLTGGNAFAVQTDAQLEAAFIVQKAKVVDGFAQIAGYKDQPEYNSGYVAAEAATGACKQNADMSMHKNAKKYDLSVYLFHQLEEMKRLVLILESRLSIITGSPVTL